MLAVSPPAESNRPEARTEWGASSGGTGSVLDHTVRLAARIFRVQMALAVRLEANSVVPWAAHGTTAAKLVQDPAWTTVLRTAEALIIPDAAESEELRASPLVLEPPGIRFYAGVPLLGGDGQRLGTFCLLDAQPRSFTEEDGETLALLVAEVAEGLKLQQANERIAAELAERKRADTLIRTACDELEEQVHRRAAALVAAEERYRSIFEHAVEGIYQIQPGGGFLSVNPAFARLLGYPSPEMLLAVVPDPTTLYVRSQERAEFERRLVQEGTIQDREMEFHRSDGSTLWLSANAYVVRDADGRILRYEGTAVDITARRSAEEALKRAHEELEDRVHERTAALALLNGDLLAQVAERQHAEEAARRSESKFRTLLENAQDLISIFSPEGVLLYASPSLQHILGYDPEELVGRSLFEGYLHPEDQPSATQRLGRTLRQESGYLRSEVRMRHRDGSWRTLESISSPLPPDFPVVGVVVNSRDITERLRNECEVEARARQQTAVAELSRLALRGTDLGAFFDQATEVVARTLNASRVGVGELLPGGERMLIRAGFGFPPEVVGRAEVEAWHTAKPDEDHPLFVADLRKVVDYSRLPSVGEAAVSAVSASIRDGDRSYGALAAMSTVARDFTPEEQVFLQTVADLLSTVIASHRHREASQEMEVRYQRIAANTPGMVYQAIRHADGTATLPFVSEGCRQIYGLEPGQLRADPNLLNDRIHPEDRPRTCAAIAVSNANLSPLQWEGRILSSDGGVRWVTVRSRPELLPNGDIYRDGVVLDVTELKHAQESLRAAKEEAERANNAKSEFLSRMSHELRTPLNAILGFGQLLQLESLQPLQMTSVEQILTGGRHLLDLVNEILDIARIEAGNAELNLEPVDLNEVAASTLSFVRPLAEQHQIRLDHRQSEVEGLLSLADRGRLNQVLLNLFSNAIKYNRPGGSVSVRCRRRPDGRLRVTVTDTGPGLSSEDIQRLFTPFQRLKAPERGIAGTGIGLTISRALVEAMGGKMGVRSKPGLGSIFHLELPAPPVRVDMDHPLSRSLTPDDHLEPTGSVARTKKVLHIDDQAANLSLIERVLGSRDDLSLLAATDGRSGLALAREERPDLILLDLHLPDLGGDEVMRRLRADRTTHEIPVLVLSADSTPAQIQRLRRLGVRDYIVKPFNIGALFQAIDAVLTTPGTK